MFRFAELRTIHLELTTRCNARCPQCPRNVFGGKQNPNLPDAELSLAESGQILPERLVAQLESIDLCGNYGDPVVAHDCLEITHRLKRIHPGLTIDIHTNGSQRGAGWWEQLAQLGTRCFFGIDGLADTNHIYRRGTSWNAIRANISAFIQAGGHAEWDFIVFAHNEHQVEEARALSRTLGFERFNLKATGRFFTKGVFHETYPVMDRHGVIEYQISPPKNHRFRNSAAQTMSGSSSPVDDYEFYIATTPISCKAAQRRSIYISAQGFVLPCCWLGLFYQRPGEGGNSEVKRLLDTFGGGLDAIDARQRTLREIVEGPIFQELIPERWKPNAKGRLRTCARICGSCDIRAAQRLVGPGSTLTF